MTEQDIMKQVDQVLMTALKNELRNQGHYLTGALENSIRGIITKTYNQVQLTGTAANYGYILNSGVTSTRVPFRSGSGAKTSKFIDALTAYFEARGLSPKEAKGAAFATAIKMKKEGMPTRASYRFSQNGRRKNFITQVKLNTAIKIDNIINRGYDKLIEQTFKKTKSETI